MFAVMKTGGKQYKVAAGDTLRVEKLAADAGETVQFNDILMLGGDSVVVGAPFVSGVSNLSQRWDTAQSSSAYLPRSASAIERALVTSKPFS